MTFLKTCNLSLRTSGLMFKCLGLPQGRIICDCDWDALANPLDFRTVEQYMTAINEQTDISGFCLQGDILPPQGKRGSNID